jgi:hypothetical protein
MIRRGPRSCPRFLGFRLRTVDVQALSSCSRPAPELGADPTHNTASENLDDDRPG